MIEQVMDENALARFREAPGPFECVLDIGACHGVVSLAAHEAGARVVIAIEPVCYNYHKLCALAHSRMGFIPICAAVKAESGRFVVMRAAGNQGQCGTRYKDDFVPIGAAVTIGINDLLRQVEPDAVKIDVEGDEWEIFAAVDPGLLARVRWLDVELHDLCHRAYYGEPAGEMCDIAGILERAGFEVDGNPLTGVRPCGHLTAVRRGGLAAAA